MQYKKQPQQFLSSNNTRYQQDENLSRIQQQYDHLFVEGIQKELQQLQINGEKNIKKNQEFLQYFNDSKERTLSQQEDAQKSLEKLLEKKSELFYELESHMPQIARQHRRLKKNQTLEQRYLHFKKQEQKKEDEYQKENERRKREEWDFNPKEIDQLSENQSEKYEYDAIDIERKGRQLQNIK